MAGENTKTNPNDVSDTDAVIPPGICALWKRGLFVDYTVKVKSRKFKVHKIVLTSMSDYFRVMLTGTLAESQADCVEVQGVSGSVMDRLITFMYTNKMKLTTNTAADVLAGAMYLQVPTAARRCTDFIVRHINGTNWFDVLSLFRRYNLTDAIQDVKAFIVKQDITKINYGVNDLSELSHDYVHFLLDAMQCPEFYRVAFITEWVEADVRLRKKHLKELLDKVQYCLISPSDLAVIKTRKTHRSCRSDLKQLVDKGMAYHELPMHQKVIYHSTLSEPRGKPTFVCFSKTSDAGVGFDVEMTTGIKVVADEAFRLPEGVLEVDGDTVVNNFLVICATVHTQGHQEWYIFNPLTKHWTQMANLHRPFHGGFLANDGKYLYAIGGLMSFPPTQATSTSIDRYDFHTNTWSSFAELRFAGTGHSACILDDKLYVSGGRMNDQLDEASMDCLDLSTQRWEMKPPMLEPMSDHLLHIMTVEEEKVICILNDSFFVEYYSPKADKWYAASFTFSKPVPREDEVGMIWADGNKLYLVDIDLKEAFGEQGMAYQLLTYPENGDSVEVPVMKKYKSAVIDPAKVHCTRLRLPCPPTKQN